MEASRSLSARVRRLEAAHGLRGACETCGSAAIAPLALAGGTSVPEWAEGRSCRDCGRAIRWYAGVDLALV